MSVFLRGTWLILILELKQRVRGVAWYVILGVFFVLVALVTVGAALTIGLFGSAGGGILFSVIIYFVLLLASLMSPALSGNAINGEREGGTLATIQVTSITTGQIVIGKFFAAWITSLALLVVTLPFLGIAVAFGGVSPVTMLSSLAILAAELGVLAGIGVGLSGLIRKPLFSVVVSYLTVAALSIGTLIVFALAGAVTQTPVTSTYRYIVSSDYDAKTGQVTNIVCSPPQTTTSSVPRFDYYWGFLAANPYVVVADASYGDFTDDGSPTDLFGWIAYGVSAAQAGPATHDGYDECSQATPLGQVDITAEQQLKDRVPSWLIGLSIQMVLAAAAITGAWAFTRTPSKRLAKGSRIA
jgi:ABC-type transport system involved in multi-copper enzyme maturation permease subunit